MVFISLTYAAVTRLLVAFFWATYYRYTYLKSSLVDIIIIIIIIILNKRKTMGMQAFSAV